MFQKIYVQRTPVPVVTALPSGARDGDEVILTDSMTSPTYSWRLRYNAGSGNTDKWEFVGGAPAFSQVNTLENATLASYAALTTAGPSIVIPRPGIYVVDTGCRKTSQSAASILYMSYDIGATGAVDADALVAYDNVGSGSSGGGSYSRSQQKTIATGATSLVAKYRLTVAATVGVQDRYMRVTPVRLS